MWISIISSIGSWPASDLDSFLTVIPTISEVYWLKSYGLAAKAKSDVSFSASGSPKKHQMKYTGDRYFLVPNVYFFIYIYFNKIAN